MIGAERLRARLLGGERLRVKLGIDPTSPHLHLGRAVALLKLRAFQELGHQVILLVGNATGVIGDTSDKDAERPMLTDDVVEENMKTYKEQAGKILDMDQVEFVYNAQWLNKLGYKEIGEHADAFSLHEFIARDNIKKRLDAGKRVSLREVLYPLMQGYDSVALKADVELGGSDQRFNLLAGRVLQEKYNQEPQSIVMSNLIMGTDGRKMSSSWGNTIALTDSARTMGEKIMNIPDAQIEEYFIHTTRRSLQDIKTIMQQPDPRVQKVALAGDIIALYFDAMTAQNEQEYLTKKFITKEHFDNAIDVAVLSDGMTICTAVSESGGAQSKSDARRKIMQGGVSIDGEKITDPTQKITADADGKILKVGKKFFRKISLQ